jgi:hypothetical protein
MIRYWFAAVTALAVLTGVAAAQTSSSTTSTQSTTAAPALPIGGSSSSSTQSTDSNGVETNNTKTNQKGITVTPSGNLGTTNKTTDTTTVR